MFSGLTPIEGKRAEREVEVGAVTACREPCVIQKLSQAGERELEFLIPDLTSALVCGVAHTMAAVWGIRAFLSQVNYWSGSYKWDPSSDNFLATSKILKAKSFSSVIFLHVLILAILVQNSEGCSMFFHFVISSYSLFLEIFLKYSL